jgi:single-stranded-DNA-specific exonuclease
VKRDLQESKLYQARQNQSEIEKVLYYSNYETLKKWFENCMDNIGTSKEEVVYGL